MTVVIGTAGHIDHGKTALLRALTGIDADRLPEERRRGMTIDVGYAWLTLPDGEALDFVDVPGHDRLVGNMLVGAGEIDAVMLIVAADEGPRAQTFEHLELLDALDIRDGLAVLTKLDLIAPDDPRRVSRPSELAALLAGTSLARSPIVAVSAVSGEGIGELRCALDDLRRRLEARPGAPGARRTGGARLAVDRAFTVRGRGVVVTGTLRGGRLERGESLRLEPGARSARARELQVHGHPVAAVAGSGRVALSLAGIERGEVVRGDVVASGPAIVASDRLLVELHATPGSRTLTDGAELRLHVGTDEVLGHLSLATGRLQGATEHQATDRSGRATEQLAVVRLTRPIAVALDDRFVLRWPSPPATAAGGRVLDPLPAPRSLRRRPSLQALAQLAAPGSPADRFAALVAVHGALPRERAASYAAALVGSPAQGSRPAEQPAQEGQPAAWQRGPEAELWERARIAGPLLLEPGLAAALEDEALHTVAAWLEAHPLEEGLSLRELRPQLGRTLRRAAFVGPREATQAVGALIDGLVTTGRLVRVGGLLCDPTSRPSIPAPLVAAMERLLAALQTAAPPALADAVREAGCGLDGVRLLESSGRIVRVAPDLAYATPAYRELEALALRLAASAPLTPAVFRDASGTSRKYALAILEEMDSRGLLRRGPDGHRLGPAAPRVG